MRTALFALLAAAHLAAQADRFGLPACSAVDQQLAVRAAFTLCHSNAKKVPVWTAYELTPDKLHAAW